MARQLETAQGAGVAAPVREVPIKTRRSDAGGGDLRRRWLGVIRVRVRCGWLRWQGDCGRTGGGGVLRDACVAGIRIRVRVIVAAAPIHIIIVSASGGCVRGVVIVRLHARCRAACRLHIVRVWIHINMIVVIIVRLSAGGGGAHTQRISRSTTGGANNNNASATRIGVVIVAEIHVHIHLIDVVRDAGVLRLRCATASAARYHVIVVLRILRLLVSTAARCNYRHSWHSQVMLRLLLG